MFRQVAILGTGLMGGSLAAALRARQPGVRLVGFGREPDISRAMELGLFDVRADSVADALWWWQHPFPSTARWCPRWPPIYPPTRC